MGPARPLGPITSGLGHLWTSLSHTQLTPLAVQQASRHVSTSCVASSKNESGGEPVASGLPPPAADASARCVHPHVLAPCDTLVCRVLRAPSACSRTTHACFRCTYPSTRHFFENLAARPIACGRGDRKQAHLSRAQARTCQHSLASWLQPLRSTISISRDHRPHRQCCQRAHAC